MKTLKHPAQAFLTRLRIALLDRKPFTFKRLFELSHVNILDVCRARDRHNLAHELHGLIADELAKARILQDFAEFRIRGEQRADIITEIDDLCHIDSSFLMSKLSSFYLSKSVIEKPFHLLRQILSLI